MTLVLPRRQPLLVELADDGVGGVEDVADLVADDLAEHQKCGQRSQVFEIPRPTGKNRTGKEGKRGVRKTRPEIIGRLCEDPKEDHRMKSPCEKDVRSSAFRRKLVIFAKIKIRTST